MLFCQYCDTSKRTGIWLIQKNAFIKKDVPLVLLDNNQGFLPSILVIHQELNLGSVFMVGMNWSHVMTAFPALLAFKYHSSPALHGNRL